MPSFSELVDQIRRVLPGAKQMPVPMAIEALDRAGARDLAVLLAQETGQLRIAPPIMYDPPGNAFGEVREYDASGRETRVSYGTYAQAPSPYANPQRPPAKEPTSTTTIGTAEAIDAEYAALVAELGIHSGAVDLETFKALVPRAGLRIYHDEEVRQYLHGKYNVPVGDLSREVLWGWRPLREVDRTPGRMVGFNGKIQRSAPAYTKPIPLPVLLTVKTVRDACPSAKFFVSDEMQAERIPDPFLLVEIGGQQFVIERWDEPAFRAKA